MKDILTHLFEYKHLTREEARQVLIGIARGTYNQVQMAAFMTAFVMRNITVEELEGFRDALLELRVPIDLSEFDPMDVCGTGGDGKDTFNISTLSCFVVAAAGQNVAKHGNHGVSSLCGSSTVLEYFGAPFTNDPEVLKRTISRSGVCFLHAPMFHPALKNVGPVRGQLGIKTFFNILGPMVNPTMPSKQLIGVFNLEIMRLYAYLYQQTDKNFLIVHGLDGYDEVSLTGPFKISTALKDEVIHPQDLGFPVLAPELLSGGTTVAESAGIFEAVLRNTATEAQKEVVIANAGLALYAANPSSTLDTEMLRAREALESGKALQHFKSFLEAS
ncbi:anthranilate phosphoribosyltransferase [Ravibacter arvi]|uniref:Anthranilate phosphoribosyltransferase n=1 Tax=Ravibacter arvi TaxID=2051041 RepID=A0ABP8M508_9BACT